jgi:hypothetical protein
MPFSERQRLVLLGVLRDQQQLSDSDGPEFAGLSRDVLGRRRLRACQARAGLVPMNLAGWIGHVPSNSECVLFHREYARLEGMGLLVRHNPYGGRRTSHLALTPAGRKLSQQLLAEEYGGPTSADSESIDWSNVEFLPIDVPLKTDPEESH